MSNSHSHRPTFCASDKVQLVRNPSAKRWDQAHLDSNERAGLLSAIIANGQVLSAEGATMTVNSLPGIVKADSGTGVFVDDDAHMFIHTHNQK